MPVDNFEIIKPLLEFKDEHDFYFLQVIQRKKDNKGNNLSLASSNNNRLIKAYYIYSIEQLDKYKHEIVSLCDLFTARAGINLNKRNARSMSLEMLALLATNIKNNHFTQLSKLYNTVCGQYHHDKDKKWILDVDGFVGFTIIDLERRLEEIEPKGKKVIAYIPSKNGYHAIVKPFNPIDFHKAPSLYSGVEIHKNNPTNLYIP